MLRIRQCKKRSSCPHPKNSRKELVSEINTSSFIDIDFTQNSVFIFILAISKVMQISVHYIKVVHRPLGRCISGLILFTMFFFL